MATTVDVNALNRFMAGKINRCPLCQKVGTYTVLPTLMELREFQEGNIVLGGNSQLVPLVVLTCTNCGNTILINALKAGVISNEKKKED